MVTINRTAVVRAIAYCMEKSDPKGSAMRAELRRFDALVSYNSFGNPRFALDQIPRQVVMNESSENPGLKRLKKLMFRTERGPLSSFLRASIVGGVVALALDVGSILLTHKDLLTGSFSIIGMQLAGGFFALFRYLRAREPFVKTLENVYDGLLASSREVYREIILKVAHDLSHTGVFVAIQVGNRVTAIKPHTKTGHRKEERADDRNAEEDEGEPGEQPTATDIRIN